MRNGNINPGYENVNVHMKFDIKMDGRFTRKAILVADVHTTALTSSITYSSVVSRESVRIAFLLAYLNDLDIFECDIGNVYLNAKFRYKIWTESGSKFETEKGIVMIISIKLCGLKSSGATWRANISETLISLG